MSTESTPEIGRSTVYISVMLLLCVIAVFLNLLVIFVVVKYGQYRASIDIFVTNLAASDVIQAGVVLPVHFKSVNADFYGDNAVCKLIMVIPLISVMAAILTIVAMAVDRFRVIILQKNLNRNGALLAIGLIWLSSFIVSSPQIYEYNIFNLTEVVADKNVTHTSCGSEGIAENFEKIYASLVLSFAYCLPLSVIIVCYTRITLFIWRHARRFRQTTAQTADQQEINHNPNQGVCRSVSERNLKVFKMLITVTTSFMFLWTPYFVLFAMTEVTDTDNSASFGEWTHMTSRAMSTFSTITNPIMYLVSSQTFKRHVQTLVRHVQCCRSSSIEPILDSPKTSRNRLRPSTSYRKTLTPVDTGITSV